MTSEDPMIKILLIGPANSGKTALVLRYVDDYFDSYMSTATIGVDFRVKMLSVQGKPYRLLLFDTAGMERFRTLTSSYYRNAQGCILVYDISNRESFLNMDRWFDECTAHTDENIVKYLVGSKSDKETSRAVTHEEGKALAEMHGAGFIEVSSRSGENVKVPFVDMVARIVQDPELVNPKAAKKRRVGEGAVSVEHQHDHETEGIYSCTC